MALNEANDIQGIGRMTAKTTEELVNYLINLKFEDIPLEVIEKAKLCVLDTLGVALAGSITPIGKLAREFAAGVGGIEENTIYHYGDRVSCIPASYANGTMAFCHNFTDTTLSCVVHCGPVIVPAALSVAEREGNSGKEFLSAVVAGYEMMTRIGNVINSGIARMSHHKRGFHATCTTGVFGASLTASKLMGLSKDQVLDALGVAGSYACGILESVTSPETETWRTHTGIAAQNGISSAFLAKLGLKGPRTVLEGKNGFFSSFGQNDLDLNKLGESVWRKFLIMDSAFKLHNCAHVWAIPLDCLDLMKRKYQINSNDISEIKVTIPTMYSFVMDESKGGVYPRSYAEAQNNLQYVMAAMMLRGGVYIEQFNDQALTDPRMKEMANKVAVEIDPSMDEILKTTDKSPAKVRVTLRDGREFFETADYPKGSPRNPATREEIEEKFADLASIVTEEDNAWEFVRSVKQMEGDHDLRGLISQLVN